MARNQWKPNHCIFCGQPPSKKTKEHFVPRWIGKASGNDHIPLVLGWKNNRLETRSLKNLTMPACYDCNNSLSEFESASKLAFASARNGVLTRNECVVLLDWIDKLRVGFWLYELAMRKEIHNIEPRFTIFDRIDSSDRYLSIAKLSNPSVKGLAFIGTETSAFLMMPSVFGFIFRDLVFISYSNAACMSDFHGFTVKDKKTHPDREFQGRIRLITGKRSFESLSKLGWYPSLRLFSFGRSTYHLGLEKQVYFEKNEPPRLLKSYETVSIPTIKNPKNTAIPVIHLSTYELQKTAFDAVNDYEINREEAYNIYRLRRELDEVIDQNLQQLNASSIFKYQRRTLRTPTRHWLQL